MCPSIAPLVRPAVSADLKGGRMARSNGAPANGAVMHKASRREQAAGQPTELVAGKEVVNRRISVWWQRPQEWVKGVVKEFDASTCKHRVVYLDRTHKEEEWLALGACRFSWLDEPRQGQAPNPTFAALPEKEDLVGRKVKVFWPAMGRWYIGMVKAYDGRTKKHRIAYKDGDQKIERLRHMAVLLMDAPTSSTAPAVSQSAAASSHTKASPTGNAAKASTASGSQRPSRSEASESKPVMQPTRQSQRSANRNAAASDAGADSSTPQQPDASIDASTECRRSSRSRRMPSREAPTAVRHTGESADKVRSRRDSSGSRHSRRRRRSRALTEDFDYSDGSEDSDGDGGSAYLPSSRGAESDSKRPRGSGDDGEVVGSPPKLARLGEQQAVEPKMRSVSSIPTLSVSVPSAEAAAAGHAADRRASPKMASISPHGAMLLQPSSSIPMGLGLQRPFLRSVTAIPPQPASASAGPPPVTRPFISAAYESTATLQQQPMAPAQQQQQRHLANDLQAPASLATAAAMLANGGMLPDFASGLAQQRQNTAPSPPQGSRPGTPLSAPASTLGFSLQATTLQAALSMPLMSSPHKAGSINVAASASMATATSQPRVSAAADSRPEQDPIRTAAGLLRQQLPKGPAAPAQAASPAAAAAHPSQQLQQAEPQRRRSKLPPEGSQPSGGAPNEARPLRAARLAAAVAGGPGARGDSALQGARVAVYWREDAEYYKGTLSALDGYHKRAKVSYDDGEEEWLALPRHTFRWLSPRARSAGCTEPLKRALSSLGAQGMMAAQLTPPLPAASVEPLPQSPRAQQQPGEPEAAPPAPLDPVPPTGSAAVGQMVSVWCPGDGNFYRGEILAYDRHRGQHHILYEDGEDEALRLAAETLRWHGPAPDGASTAGLQKGKPVPRGKAAVGWRIGVYWQDDRTFYTGDVTGYDVNSGRHAVEYDDGEKESVMLGREKMKWLLPPEVGPSEDTSRRRRPRSRRQGWDSDDTSEEEEEDMEMSDSEESDEEEEDSDGDEMYMPRAQPSRSTHRASCFSERSSSGAKITRLPPPQPPPLPTGEPVCVRTLPNIAALGLSPSARPGVGGGSGKNTFSRLSKTSHHAAPADSSGPITVSIYCSRPTAAAADAAPTASGCATDAGKLLPASKAEQPSGCSAEAAAAAAAAAGVFMPASAAAVPASELAASPALAHMQQRQAQLNTMLDRLAEGERRLAMRARSTAAAKRTPGGKPAASGDSARLLRGSSSFGSQTPRGLLTPAPSLLAGLATHSAMASAPPRLGLPALRAPSTPGGALGSLQHAGFVTPASAAGASVAPTASTAAATPASAAAAVTPASVTSASPAAVTPTPTPPAPPLDAPATAAEPAAPAAAALVTNAALATTALPASVPSPPPTAAAPVAAAAAAAQALPPPPQLPNGVHGACAAAVGSPSVRQGSDESVATLQEFLRGGGTGRSVPDMSALSGGSAISGGASPTSPPQPQKLPPHVDIDAAVPLPAELQQQNGRSSSERRSSGGSDKGTQQQDCRTAASASQRDSVMSPQTAH